MRAVCRVVELASVTATRLCDGNMTEAASRLGINISVVYRKR
jgi:transcriptional regulator of acetoin/glycerol metabolism